MAGFLDKLPPRTEKGVRILKGLFYSSLLFIAICAILFTMMRFEPYKCGAFGEEALSQYGWTQDNVKRYVSYGVGDVVTYSYNHEGGYGRIVVYTYSYPVPRGLYSKEAMDTLRDVAEGGLYDYYTIDSSSVAEKHEKVGRYDATIRYVDMSAETTVASSITVKSNFKFLVATFLMDDSKALGTTVVTIVGYINTGNEYSIAGGQLYSQSLPDAEGNLLDVIKSGIEPRAPPAYN